MARLGRRFPAHAIWLRPVPVPAAATLTSDVAAGARAGTPVDGAAVGVTLTSDIPAGTRTGAPADALAVGVTLVSDAPSGARTGSPVDNLAISVIVTSDISGDARTAAPVDTPNAQVSGPTLLTSDVAAGVRTASPVDTPAIGVQLATDVAGAARTGAPTDGPVQVGVTATSDIPSGARTGAPGGDTPIVGVTLTGDVAAGARTGAPVDALAVGIVLTSDIPTDTRTASPVDAVGNTATSDVAAGARTAAPVDVLTVGVTLTVDVPAGTRIGNPADQILIGVTLVMDIPAGARTGNPGQDAIGNTATSDVPAGNRIGNPADQILIGVTLTVDVPAGTRTASPVDTLGGSSSFGGLVQNANPNWPLVCCEVDFTSGPPTAPPTTNRASVNVTYRRLYTRKISITRGRQYELDQVQAGQATVEIPDPSELLNPDNAASPYNTAGNTITPYRAMWIYAVWPNQPGSGNLYNPNITPGVDPSFEAGVNGFFGWDGTASVAASTLQHFTGTQSLLVTQTAAGFTSGAYTQAPNRTGPGITYTVSAYVYPTGGASVTIGVYDALGAIHTSGTATTQNVWARLSVTWTTVDTLEYVNIYGTGVAAPTFYVDAMQLEFGQGATPYTATGPTLYPQFSGYVERWPTAYDMGGQRAVRPLLAVDALAILSRTAVNQTYAAEIAKDQPSLVMPYSESGPPNRATTANGTLLTQGTQSTIQGGSVTWAGDTFLDGSAAVTLSQTIQDPIPFPWGTQFAAVDIPHNNSYSINTGGATLEVWARWTSGSVNFGMFGANRTGQYNTPYDDVSNIYTGVRITLSGLTFTLQDQGASHGYAANSTAVYDGTNTAAGGAWHLYAMAFSPASAPAAATTYRWTTRFDGGEFFLNSLGLPIRQLGANQITSNAATVYGDPQSGVSIAKVAVYPSDIGIVRRAAHYLRGVGYVGEVSGARVTRLLTKYWAGPMSVAAGYTRMAADHGYNTRTVLDVCQEIQETERGLFYASAAGVVVFEDRTSRLRSAGARWVFGENPAGAAPVEYPYSEYKADFDPTYTFSQANLTRPGNSAFPPVVNAATQAKYGQRILTQQAQVNTDFDLAQAGIFYLARYGSPRTRISLLTLDPAANPALWPVVLSLELSQRVTVTRRLAGVTVTRDYYVEQINHKIDGDAGTWKTDLQLSPVFVPQVWTLGDTTQGVLGTTTVPTY